MRFILSTGSMRVAFLARLYQTLTFHGFTWGHWGFGLVHFIKDAPSQENDQ